MFLFYGLLRYSKKFHTPRALPLFYFYGANSRLFIFTILQLYIIIILLAYVD